jgi:signal transduction histidine kinase
VEDIRIIVVTNYPQITQSVQTSLSASKQIHQDLPNFNVDHSSPTDLPPKKKLVSVRAVLIDHLTGEELGHDSRLELLERFQSKPIIVICQSKQDLSRKKNFWSDSVISLPSDEIRSTLFYPYLVNVITRTELTHKLEQGQDDQNKRIHELESIHQASLHITENLSLEDVLEGILETAQSLIGGDDSLIYLYEHGDLSDGLYWGFDGNRYNNQPLTCSNEHTYLVKKGRKIDLVDEGSVNPILMYQNWQGSIYDLELKTSRSLIGGMTLGFRKRHQFTEHEKRILQMLADQAAIAIENARLFKIANQLAVIDERNRLARELHDSVAQALYGITLFAKASQRQLNKKINNTLVSQLATIQATALDALREMRLLLYELRPSQVESQGFIPALINRLESVEERSGVATEFILEGTPNLSEPVQDALYRISQEALNNALKHSRANHLTVSLKCGKAVSELIIKDDGIGFNPDQYHRRSGLGIRSMKERVKQIGGKFRICTSPGEGTSIKIEVPHES